MLRLAPSDMADRRALGEADAGPDLRRGAVAMALFFAGFLGFASLVRLDAGAAASGVLIAAGENAPIQHADGGVVAKVFVREGELVRTGQPILSLRAVAETAEARSLDAAAIEMTARRARLLAETRGVGSVTAPPEFARLPQDRREIALLALARHREIFASRRAQTSLEIGAGREKVAQLMADQAAENAQLEALNKQIASLSAELEGMRRLLERGFVAVNRVRALERTEAELVGSRETLQARQARTAAAIREAEDQLSALIAEKRRASAEELAETEAALGKGTPMALAAAERAEQAILRAPKSGRILDLAVRVPGETVAPGQVLASVVPSQEPLVIEAKVQPEDADDVSVGQQVEIRITAFPSRRLPILIGRLASISADRLEDEKGQGYFAGEVSVPAEEVLKLQRALGPSAHLKAGLPAEVIIRTRKRTLLDYLIEPLAGSLWRSFRES